MYFPPELARCRTCEIESRLVKLNHVARGSQVQHVSAAAYSAAWHSREGCWCCFKNNFVLPHGREECDKDNEHNASHARKEIWRKLGKRCVCVCCFFDQFKALLPLGMHQNYDKSDVRKNSPQWMMVY